MAEFPSGDTSIVSERARMIAAVESEMGNTSLADADGGKLSAVSFKRSAYIPLGRTNRGRFKTGRASSVSPRVDDTAVDAADWPPTKLPAAS